MPTKFADFFKWEKQLRSTLKLFLKLFHNDFSLIDREDNVLYPSFLNTPMTVDQLSHNVQLFYFVRITSVKATYKPRERDSVNYMCKANRFVLKTINKILLHAVQTYVG